MKNDTPKEKLPTSKPVKEKLDIDLRTKLKTRLYIKQVARKNIDGVYDILDKWKTERKKLARKKQDTTMIDFKIEELNNELDRIEGNNDEFE